MQGFIALLAGHSSCSRDMVAATNDTKIQRTMQAVAELGFKLRGGSFSFFFLPPSFFFFLLLLSSSSSSLMLEKCWGALGGLHGFYGSRGAGAPPAPLAPPLFVYKTFRRGKTTLKIFTLLSVTLAAAGEWCWFIVRENYC